MKNLSVRSAELKALAAVTFLLPFSSASICAQEVVPPLIDIPAPAAKPAPSLDELREQLIASVRADLLAARAKEEHSNAVTTLAQAIEALVSEAAPEPESLAEWIASQRQQSYGRRTSSWQNAVQAHGSEKSMKLGIQYAQRLQREGVEQSARRGAELEAMAKKSAEQVFAAKTAAELDPILEQIAPFAQQSYQITGISQEVLRKLQQFHQFLTAWQSHLAAREAGNPEEALQALRQFRSDQRVVPWVPRSELVKQIDAAKRATGLPGPDDVAAAIKRVSEKALEAGKGEAVDPLLLEMRQLQKLLQSEDVRSQSNQVQQLISFLETWQKALILRETGNVEGLKEALRQLEGYGTRGLDIPRSQIIERVLAMGTNPEAKGADGKSAAPSKIESPQAILDRVQQLEDLAPALTALNAAVQLLPQNSPERFAWAQTLQELQTISRQHDELRNGLATRVNLGMNFTGTPNPKVLELQRQLSLASLHRLLGEELKMAPEANENATTYLRRMLAAARDRKEWRLVQRTLETAQATNVQDPLLKATDTTAISSFITATTQERARQYAFATASYLGALKSGSEWVPVEEIGDRLQAIEKEHAADYAQGVEWARTPAVPNLPPNYYPPGYRGPSNPYTTPRQSGEQPVLIPERKAPARTEEAEKK